METLREYRKKVNVSQRILAEILKTTRSQIAMAERGERPLPKDAKNRFAIMQTLQVDINTIKDASIPMLDDAVTLADETLCIWQARAAENHWQQYNKKRLLRTMKIRYDLLIARQLELYKAVIAISETGGHEVEVNFMKDKQMMIHRKILTCGRIAQLRLQLSIDLLLAEADILNQYVASATAEAAAPM